MTIRTDDEVMFEGALDAAPEKVWRALTVPELLSAWLLPADRDGDGLKLDGAAQQLPPIACEVIEAKAPDLLRYRWQAADEAESIVTFELTRITGGTWLRLVQEPAPARILAAANSNTPTMMLAA